jgi:rhodanese-related sulfurtransferase/SAM-dependent methyltransferase
MTAKDNKTLVQLPPESALTQLRQQKAVIIDVRQPAEYDHEHIAGAVSLPLETLTPEQLPPGTMALFYCGAGKRSCSAAQRLMDMGCGDVAVVEGGIAGWKAAGLPTARSLSALAPNEIKAAVAERYGRVATAPGDKFNFPVGRRFADSVGYDAAVLDRLPHEMWESFSGAGNPHAFIDAQPGETVLDLGCGAGLDLYLHAQKVGPTGKLYGLDLSQAMLDKARGNLAAVGVTNVDWLHAPADAIPLPDRSVDLVTANGIFNLSPDKDAVMREVARVLRPGGRTVFAEIVLQSELPGEIRRELDDWFRCIGGALVQEDFLARLERNGLSQPQVLWIGRNARTGHELSLSAVIRAERQP